MTSTSTIDNPLGFKLLDFDEIDRQAETRNLERRTVVFDDGTGVIIRELLGHERGELEDSIQQYDPKTGVTRTRTRDYRERVVMLSCIKPDGTALYPHENRDIAAKSMKKIGRMHARKLAKIVEESHDLSGITVKLDEDGHVDEENTPKGNSSETPSDD